MKKQKAAKEFTSIAHTQKKYSQMANRFMTVALGEINLQSERSHLSRSKSESCEVSAFNDLHAPFFSVFTKNINFESKALIKPKENTFHRP